MKLLVFPTLQREISAPSDHLLTSGAILARNIHVRDEYAWLGHCKSVVLLNTLKCILEILRQ